MTTHGLAGNNSPHPMAWIAGIALIVFCMAGIAAIFGWIPGSLGGTSGAPAISAAGKPPAKSAGAAAVKSPMRETVCLNCGVIVSMREVVVTGEGSGVGAVGGAVVGGLLGHQVGGGSGKQIATVVGAVGGAVAGNEVEKRIGSTKTQEITVQLDDGSNMVVRDSGPAVWRSGDRVKITDGALRRN